VSSDRTSSRPCGSHHVLRAPEHRALELRRTAAEDGHEIDAIRRIGGIGLPRRAADSSVGSSPCHRELRSRLAGPNTRPHDDLGTRMPPSTGSLLARRPVYEYARRVVAREHDDRVAGASDASSALRTRPTAASKLSTIARKALASRLVMRHFRGCSRPSLSCGPPRQWAR